MSFLLLVCVWGNDNNNKLSGIWEENQNVVVSPVTMRFMGRNATISSYPILLRYPVSIEFSGSNFTIIEYPIFSWNIRGRGYGTEDELIRRGVSVEFRPGNTFIYQAWGIRSFLFNIEQVDKFINFDNNFINEKLINELNLIYIESFDTRPVIGGIDRINRLEGKKDQLYKREIKGTYSIIDDKIEFLFQDGTKEIFSFSHSENTITILFPEIIFYDEDDYETIFNEMRFIRKP